MMQSEVTSSEQGTATDGNAGDATGNEQHPIGSSALIKPKEKPPVPTKPRNRVSRQVSSQTSPSTPDKILASQISNDSTFELDLPTGNTNKSQQILVERKSSDSFIADLSRVIANKPLAKFVSSKSQQDLTKQSSENSSTTESDQQSLSTPAKSSEDSNAISNSDQQSLSTPANRQTLPLAIPPKPPANHRTSPLAVPPKPRRINLAKETSIDGVSSTDGASSASQNDADENVENARVPSAHQSSSSGNETATISDAVPNFKKRSNLVSRISVELNSLLQNPSNNRALRQASLTAQAASPKSADSNSLSNGDASSSSPVQTPVFKYPPSSLSSDSADGNYVKNDVTVTECGATFDENTKPAQLTSYKRPKAMAGRRKASSQFLRPSVTDDDETEITNL